jgi:hypothetical protein
VDDGLIAEADNPARKVAKPRRLPITRRALPDTRLAEINETAATTSDVPELDTLILRPITHRRYDHLWGRIGRHLPWVATQGI